MNTPVCLFNCNRLFVMIGVDYVSFIEQTLSELWVFINVRQLHALFGLFNIFISFCRHIAAGVQNGHNGFNDEFQVDTFTVGIMNILLYY